VSDPKPKPSFIPDTSRLLAVFSGIPLKSRLALELAELRQAGDPPKSR
jgi:hypothetical protein